LKSKASLIMNRIISKSFVKGAILPFTVAMLLTGCQRYEWVHPTKSLEQFGRDKFACEERASRIYPLAPVTTVEGGGFIYDEFHHCHRRFDGFGECYARPPIYVPPTYSTRDMNESARNQAVEACLFSKGYQLVPAK
jgi:hypothetical protein